MARTRRDSQAEGSSRTRRDTERESAGRRARTRRESGRSGSPAFFGIALPPGLDERVEIVEQLPAKGAEAEILKVRSKVHEFEGECALKMYRWGLKPDFLPLEKLTPSDAASRTELLRHIAEILDYGAEEGVYFELQEYCPQGSLRDLIDQGGQLQIKKVVEELASALEYIHRIGLVHRDLKPENVLVRRLDPLDLVLTDFGIARAMDGATSRWTTSRWATQAYAPPESIPDKPKITKAWDWWSFGMVVAELAGKRHPFALDAERLMADLTIQHELMTREVDLSAVSDARLQLLCRGLLTKDHFVRWGADQVKEWMTDGSPEVAQPALDQPPQPQLKRRRDVLFNGQKYHTPSDLAAGFQQSWDKALRELFQDPEQGLIDETVRLLEAYDLPTAAGLLKARRTPADLPYQFADLLKEMDPQLEPLYRGITLTKDGLEDAALQVVEADGNHPAVAILDEVRQHRILRLWRDLPGMEHGPETQEQWDNNIAALDQALGSTGREQVD